MFEKSYKELNKYCYFSHLSDGALEGIAKKLRPVSLKAGTEIIREGLPGDAFYLVHEGEVNITKKTKWGQTAPISVLGNGQSFGEMALLTCSARTCTVTACSDVVLYKLSRRDFDEIIHLDSTFSQVVSSQIESYSQFNRIKTLQPFALIEPEKMDALMMNLIEKKFAAGEKIIIEGERGDEYFVIKSGRVSLYINSSDNKAQHLTELSEGEGFGEEALLTGLPRNATVQAVEDTAVWSLSKPVFDKIVKSTYVDVVFPEDVLEEQFDGNHFIDVRMKVEYDEEHIPEAANIPLKDLRNRYKELDPSIAYYVYCLSGPRSSAASFLLNTRGIKAKSLVGGMSAWTGPVVEGNSSGVHAPCEST